MKDLEFQSLAIDELPALSKRLKDEGWRFANLHGVRTDEGISLIYAFMKDGSMVNYRVDGITKEVAVPAISNEFFSAFVFENETHDLFGVNIEGMAIDFKGNFYKVAVNEPMTVLSPEQIAAREKAAKVAAAKAAKAAKEATQQQTAPASAEDSQAQADAEFEAKLAKMDPEKAAKARAAYEAKKAKAAAKAGE